jgi:hypothetical protein
VTSSDALLALIGHQWLAAAAGPNDFVRVEIESARTRGIRVIPVLVEPAPVSVSDLHVGASGRLRAVVTTIDGGQAVHLELWLNGKKLIDYTDRDSPYTRGYMGLYVESISDSPSTAAAEFDNFTAAQS